MTNLEGLAQAWLDAKREETAATDKRHKIEAQLASALDTKAEGSITHKLDGYKVTLTQPVSRKLDERAWPSVAGYCPPAMAPIKTKVEADAPGCKWLAENHPEIWRKISPAFETKPGKIGVKVEAI